MKTDKLLNETETEYELLQTFLLMGFGRSVTQLAELHSVSRQYIYNLMKKNDWKSRIASHDKKILKEIREKHNLSFQTDAVLRRENVVNAYSLLQNTFAKMLSYSDRYTSNNMEADEFPHKTDKLFSIIQRYEKISQSCEKYLSKFGIELAGQEDDLNKEVKETTNHIEDFSDNHIEESEDEILNEDQIIDFNDYLPKQDDNFELTEEELKIIEDEVENGYPHQDDIKGKKNYRKNLIFNKMKNKYKMNCLVS